MTSAWRWEGLRVHIVSNLEPMTEVSEKKHRVTEVSEKHRRKRQVWGGFRGLVANSPGPPRR